MGTFGAKLDYRIAKMQKNCKGCIYYGESSKMCDYIEIMGHRRPCPPGDKCTVKVMGRKKRAIGFNDDSFGKGKKIDIWFKRGRNE